MKHLVILGHPSTDSLNKVIHDEIAHLYKKHGHDITVRDLYSMNFNPVLSSKDIQAARSGKVLPDVKTEQDYIKKADVITFIYPLWWTAMPAIVKGYIDRVFSYGFAYAFTPGNDLKKLLKGKKVILINTHGMPADLYQKSGVYDAMNLLTEKHTFEFFGMEVLLHYYLDNISDISDQVYLKTRIDELKVEIKNTLGLVEGKLNLNSHFFF